VTVDKQIDETTRDALEILQAEEAAAWQEYLEQTQGQESWRYDEIEPWAWSRLRTQLRAIKARRAKLG
jgi:hypothetical protein